MRRGRTTFRITAFAAALLLAGCSTTKVRDTWARIQKPFVGDHPAPADAMAHAEEAYRREEFAKAEELFQALADDTRQRPEIAEQARFFQAECLRKQDYFPKAVDAYHKLLQDFPAGLYRSQAAAQMYQIASSWLQPVREEIEDSQKPEKERRHKDWTSGIVLVNFDRKTPTFASEERALQTLDQVYFGDPTGPTADKALFMLGAVHFHRKNFSEASRYFQQLVETADKSKYRDDALRLAILAKTQSSTGPEQDGKDTTEAMRLINTARATSPQLVREHGEMLDKQSMVVRMQQAEKDYEIAEHYRRTGHPGPAWFCYELVKRRYPGIKPWEDKAIARQAELKSELDEANNPTMWSSTRRIWKQYVLGHESPTGKLPGGSTNLKDVAETRPEPIGPARAPVPADVRPRQ